MRSASRPATWSAIRSARLIAASFAADHPERILSLTLASVAAGQARLPAAQREKALAQRLTDVTELGPRRMAEQRGPRLLAPAATPEMLRRVVDTMASVRPDGYSQAARMLASGDIKADIPRLPAAMPVQFLYGDARRHHAAGAQPRGRGVAAHRAGPCRQGRGPRRLSRAARQVQFHRVRFRHQEYPFMKRRTLLALPSLVIPAAFLAGTRASAQAYPSKPIHIIVSVSAGGSIDTIARSYGEALSQSTGQPVIIENRPGANGNIAAAAVARAAPDGYTLLATGGSTLNLNPFLYRELPFDPVKSFTPVTLTARTNFILVVNPKLGVDSVEAFVALAKAHPKTLNYGSAGSGSLIQIATELFNTTAGIETNHVPYKGLAPAVNDLLAGQIDFMFNSATTMSHIQAGRLKALAVIGPNPLPALPELKPLSAYGIMGVDVASGWHALFAPAGTPPEIIDRLNAALQPILASAALKERIISLGAEPASSTPDQLARILANDLERLQPIVKRTGASLD